MKFLPSKADPCIWLRKAPNLRCYEYIAIYVDDLCIAAEFPSAIIRIFKSKYHLKVNGDGKLTYHLGADIRQTLRCLGAPISTKSFLFGDNRSAVTSTTLPHSTLTKRHNILAFTELGSHCCKTHGFLLDPVCLQLK